MEVYCKKDEMERLRNRESFPNNARLTYNDFDCAHIIPQRLARPPGRTVNPDAYVSHS